jgi:hypothetical protein
MSWKSYPTMTVLKSFLVCINVSHMGEWLSEENRQFIGLEVFFFGDVGKRG